MGLHSTTTTCATRGRDAPLVRHVQVAVGMALREFEDGQGERWRVWATVPARTEGLEDNFRAGWLTFDNGRERRRLAPVPSAWSELPAARLALLLRVAEPAGPRDVSGPLAAEERRVGERRQAERRLGDRRRGPPPGPGIPA